MPRSVIYSFIGKDRLTAATRKMGAGVNQLRQKMKALELDSKKVSKRMVRAGEASRRFSLVSAAGVVGSLKAFGDLEQGVANVLTLLDDDEIAKFGGQIRLAAQDAIKMGFSIEDATKALFDNVSALGVSDKSLATFRTSQKLAIAGVADLTVAVDGVTSIVNAYGRETTDATEVANAFFTAQKRGKTTVALLASNVGKLAPIAKPAGVGFKEMLSTASELTLGGLATEEATTALKGAISSLIKPGAEARKILTHLGVPFGATAVKAAGLSNVLLKLSAANEKNADLLALAIPNIRGFTAVAALSDDAIAHAAETQRMINRDIKEGTGLNKAFTAQNKTFNREMARTFGEVKVLAAQIGEALVPTVKVLGAGIRALASGFSALSGPTKKVIAFLLVVAAVAAPILLFMGKLGLVVVAIAGGIGASFASVGLVVAGLVAAVVGGIILVMTNFDAISAKVSGFKNKFKRFFGFEGENDLNVTGTGETTSNFFGDLQVTFKDPKGVVEGVQATSSGPGLNVGVAVEGAV